MRLEKIFAAFLVLSANAIAAPNHLIENTAMRLDGSEISYYIDEGSQQKQSQDLLLVLQGSDCNSVVHIESIFSSYRNLWREADLLVIEKYGITKSLPYSSDAGRSDCPSTSLQNDNPRQRVSDANTVLKAVYEARLYKNLVVMGGSEGALIANLLAAENELVTAVVAFNGGGRWFVDDVLHNIASEYVEKEEAENSLNGFKEFYQHILTSNADELVVSGHGYSWWKQMFEIDQFLVLNDVERPVLLVQGGIDKSVSPEKFNEMMSELTDAGKENIDHLFYQYLNHSFKTAEGVHKQDDVVSEMQHWLRGILGDSE